LISQYFRCNGSKSCSGVIELRPAYRVDCSTEKPEGEYLQPGDIHNI